MEYLWIPIVAAAVFFTARHIYRCLTGGGCGCQDCPGDCSCSSGKGWQADGGGGGCEDGNVSGCCGGGRADD